MKKPLPKTLPTKVNAKAQANAFGKKGAAMKAVKGKKPPRPSAYV